MGVEVSCTASPNEARPSIWLSPPLAPLPASLPPSPSPPLSPAPPSPSALPIMVPPPPPPLVLPPPAPPTGCDAWHCATSTCLDGSRPVAACRCSLIYSTVPTGTRTWKGGGGMAMLIVYGVAGALTPFLSARCMLI
eukprot:scaffold123058_cov72-Phaeocystis_antarctica.AAC.6